MDIPFSAAPGRVLCRINRDIEEEDGFALADVRVDSLVTVVHVGQPITEEDRMIATCLSPGVRLVAPKLKGQIYGEWLAIRISEINILANDSDASHT